jgi:hypothetical protein
LQRASLFETTLKEIIMYRFSTSSNQFSFRSQSALSNDMIARYAPSVLASEAHESRGQKYTFIPTLDVIDGLRLEGFEPFEVRQTKCRDLAKREFTKHMVRMRHPDAIASQGEVPELVLINSHDGTSSYQLLAGFFRFVCSNGLIAGDIQSDVRVRHSGRVVQDVIEGSFKVLENVKQISNSIDEFKSITLDRQEQELFANTALSLRWDDKPPVTAERVLQANRYEDVQSDLWTTFNRVQENIIKGGVLGKTATGRRMHTRGVQGVNENVKLNRALWSLADGMAKLKSNVIDVEDLVVA